MSELKPTVSIPEHGLEHAKPEHALKSHFSIRRGLFWLPFLVLSPRAGLILTPTPITPKVFLDPYSLREVLISISLPSSTYQSPLAAMETKQPITVILPSTLMFSIVVIPSPTAAAAAEDDSWGKIIWSHLS